MNLWANKDNFETNPFWLNVWHLLNLFKSHISNNSSSKLAFLAAILKCSQIKVLNRYNVIIDMFACIKIWERTELDQKSNHRTILRANSKHISYLSSEYVCDVTTSWTWSEEICVVMIFPFVETFCWKKYFGEKSSEEIVRKLFCQSYLQNEEKENLQKCCKQKELEKIGSSVAAWFLSNAYAQRNVQLDPWQLWGFQSQRGSGAGAN